MHDGDGIAVVSRLLQELALKKTDKVLEIGTGSGYMAALLAARADQVTTVEINPELAKTAKANLARAGVDDVVEVRHDDGARVLAATPDASVAAVVPRGVIWTSTSPTPGFDSTLCVSVQTCRRESRKCAVPDRAYCSNTRALRFHFAVQYSA